MAACAGRGSRAPKSQASRTLPALRLLLREVRRLRKVEEGEGSAHDGTSS
jgi:hypothetical protein